MSALTESNEHWPARRDTRGRRRTWAAGHVALAKQVALRTFDPCRMLTDVNSLTELGMHVANTSRGTNVQSRPEHATQSSLPVPRLPAAASPTATPPLPPLPGGVCDVDSLPPHAGDITSPMPATTTPTNPQPNNPLAALAAWRFTLRPLHRIGADGLRRRVFVLVGRAVGRAVALLELLAAAARAQIVAPDLGRRALTRARASTPRSADERCATAGAPSPGTAPSSSSPWRAVACCELRGVLSPYPRASMALDLAPAVCTFTRKSLVTTLRADRRHHVDEEVVALFLVLLLRVALAVAAQADAVAQVLHVGEVLDPRAVDLLQVEVAEDAAAELDAELLLALWSTTSSAAS